MKNNDIRCGTLSVYSGELTIRPELDVAIRVLGHQPYAAIPSQDEEGAWEVWGAYGGGSVHRTICGMNKTYASQEEALAAGASWQTDKMIDKTSR